MTLSFYAIFVIVTVALLLGFWLGRSMKWMAEETEMRMGDKAAVQEEGEEHRIDRKEAEEGKGRYGRRVPTGRPIGSPVSGEMRPFCNGNRQGAAIIPYQGKLFAPAAGKIIKVFPMGNEMLLRTESGVELLLSAGEKRDEMYSIYYRPRVVQNEIVGKGKLLLEFDREGLIKENQECVVTVSVETTGENYAVTVTQQQTVKAGEDFMWISCMN